jgi:hypothetical protein
MMAEEPKKNQYPAYAVKSDDGKIEESLKPGMKLFVGHAP